MLSIVVSTSGYGVLGSGGTELNPGGLVRMTFMKDDRSTAVVPRGGPCLEFWQEAGYDEMHFHPSIQET